MPISLVRSSTTTFMMLLTPMPPTTSVKAPTIPRKLRKARKKVSRNFIPSVVSHIWIASSSDGSKRYLWAAAAITLFLTPATFWMSLTWKMKFSMYFEP